MNRTTIITSIIFGFLFVLGLLILIFWNIGIFREEYQPSELLIRIQNQLDMIKNYNLKSEEKYLQNLSLEKVLLPQLNQSDLGRNSLFDNPR